MNVARETSLNEIFQNGNDGITAILWKKKEIFVGQASLIHFPRKVKRIEIISQPILGKQESFIYRLNDTDEGPLGRNPERKRCADLFAALPQQTWKTIFGLFLSVPEVVAVRLKGRGLTFVKRRSQARSFDTCTDEGTTGTM